MTDLSGDLQIVLSHRSPGKSSITNWSGPGWYLAATDTDNAGEWMREPRRLGPAEVVDIAIALDNACPAVRRGEKSFLDLVAATNGLAERRLEARVRQLEATERDLTNARAELAAYRAEHPDG
jgi:hypothetical protein